MIKELYQKAKVMILEKYNIVKENVVPLSITTLITILVLLDLNVFENKLMLVVWVILGILILLLITLVMVMAGFTVLKPLFLLSAEISLLIFLAQSYCDVKERTLVGNNALGSLVSIGLLYIVFHFTKSLYDALIKNLNKIEDKKWTWEKILMVGMFLFFTGTFVFAIYQVVSPIVLDLCIYKKV